MPPTIPSSALITGATGFIGSHLAARLQREGFDTHAIVRPSSNTSALQELLGADHVHTHDGGIENMLDIVARAKPQIIFHLASLFLSNHDAPNVTPLIRTNIEFPAQLAEAAARLKVPHFIYTGTAWQHFDNQDFNPVNLYAATKQAFADILRYYTESGSFRAITLDLFDTYGPRDPRRKLFHILRNAARLPEPLAMSPGNQLIDFVYIDDVTAAFLAAAARLTESSAPSETFALSSGHPRPLREVVELWLTLTKSSLQINWAKIPRRPREMLTPWSRGIPLPNWQPRTSLEEGIQMMERASRENLSHG